MGKKVIVLAGSPRKGGNSDILCDAFVSGATAAGHSAEKIYVDDLELRACKACAHCRKNDGCVIDDGMAAIAAKMISADVIVLASPLYYYSISGQMKVFIDRCYAHFTKMRNKEFYFIVTAAAGESGIDRAMDALKGFTDCVPGAVVKDKLYGGGFYDKGTIAGSEVEKEAYQLGKNI